MSHDGPPPPPWESGEPWPPAGQHPQGPPDVGLEGLFDTPQPPPPQTPPPPPPNPYADPFADPADPAAVAAAHQASLDAAALAARPTGSHRARPGPARYVLPAVVGALVLVAVGIGVAGWIGGGSTDDGATRGSLVAGTTSSHSSSGASSAVSTQPSPTPTVSAKPTASAVAPPPAPSAKPSTHQPAPKPSATGPARPPVVHAPVVVLNETRQHGLAAEVAAHLRSLGWTVTGVGNWRGNISTTTVYYPAGMAAAARSLAYDLGVDRIRPRAAGMLPNRLTVVLTSDPLN